MSMTKHILTFAFHRGEEQFKKLAAILNRLKTDLRESRSLANKLIKEISIKQQESLPAKEKA